MANLLYPKWKQELLKGTADTTLNGTVKAALVDLANYSYNASHVFLSDIPGTAIAATTGAFTSKTYTDGTFGSANISFVAVPAGNTCEAIVLFIDTGSASTSRLVAYFDTAVANLPVTPNGGDIVNNWNVSGIFTL